MTHAEAFNKWYSERMGHPFAVQLGKNAVDELQQENAALKKANAWHVNHTNELHKDNAELREALCSIKDKLNDATSINEIEAFIYMICDNSLNKND